MALNLEEYNSGIISASHNIAGVVLKTPLLRSNWLSKNTGCNVYCKMESEQITRSFKLRGATNKIKRLVTEKGSESHNIVTASSGNHGMACAYLSSLFDVNMTVFTYTNVAKNKEAEITQYPKVDLVKFGTECQEAEEKAKQHAAANGLLYVSPYNDRDIICGQGTIGLELLEQLPDIDAVFVPVGGGGLISGIAAFLKSVKPSVKVVGVQPVNDSSMYDSVKHGSILTDNEILDTFSSGTAGRVEVGSETFDVCKDCVDEWVLLEEEEIEKAVYDMLDKEKKLIEGAAGLGVAAIQKVQDEYKNKNVVLIICGGNIGAADINGEKKNKKRQSNANGLLYVSPYNDRDISCGQGTIGLELLEQLPDIDAVFVPVGGGGLISGIAAFLKSVKPSVKVVGVQPVNNSSMYDSIKHGSIVIDNEILDTFSSATAGRLEVGCETFDFCKGCVDEWVLLEEEEIEKAVYDMLDKEKKLIEGAAGLGVAAIQKVQDEYKNKNVVLIICGGNIGAADIKYVTDKFLK